MRLLCGESMSANKTPDIWMPFYMGDFESATSFLLDDEKWHYVKVIWEYWRLGHKGERIKFDKNSIKIIARNSSKKAEKILAFFENREGYLFHARIEKEVTKAREDKQMQRRRTEAATAARIAKRKAEKLSSSIVTNDVTTNVTLNVAKSPSPSPLPKKYKRSSLDGKGLNVDNSSLKLATQPVSEDIFNVDNFLTDVDRMCVQAESIGWDYNALVITFNTWVKKNEIPKSPSSAFLAWTIKFTKGKPPC